MLGAWRALQNKIGSCSAAAPWVSLGPADRTHLLMWRFPALKAETSRRIWGSLWSELCEPVLPRRLQQRGRERERSKTDREAETESDRAKRERERERERERVRERERERERESERERERGKTDRQTDREAETELDRAKRERKKRDREGGRQREKETYQ